MALKSFSINGKQVKTLAIDGKQVKLEPPAPAYNGLKFTATQANSSVTLNKNGSPTTLNLEFSMDNGSTWQTFNVGTTYALANVGDSICLRAPEGSPNTSGTGQSGSKYHKFSLVGEVAASGNIMSLYDYDAETTVMTSYGFYFLLQQCANLVDVSQLELPATTLANNCYYGMFSECSSFTTAPELPATTLASNCYVGMFSHCKSLTAAPELPATTLASYCYNSMFQDCPSLTDAPELPATTLATYCYYYMFDGCSQLNYVKTAMSASGVNSTTNHQQWLNGVASRGTYESTDPDFDETLITTRSGSTIPSRWSITKSAVFKLTSKQAGSTVALNRNGNPATLHLEMSRNGTTWTPFVVDYTYDIGGNNDYILLRAPAGQPNTNGTAQSSSNYHQFTMTGNVETGGSIMALYSKDGGNAMTQSGFYKLFNGCSALKKAPKLPMTLAANCYAYLFAGTGITAAPELAQTTLAMGCYQHMFEGCTSLTAAPELPASTLADYCYNSMFKDCTSINEAPLLYSRTVDVGCYSNMFNGCTSLNIVRANIQPENMTSDYTDNWLANVAATGTFYTEDNDIDVTPSPTTVPSGWTTHKPGIAVEPLTFTGTSIDTKVNVSKFGNPVKLNLEYRKSSWEAGRWERLVVGEEYYISTLSISIRALAIAPNEYGMGQSTSDYHQISVGVGANASGNIMSLYDFAGQTYMTDYGFYHLFDNIKLTTVPDLPATTLAPHCYDYMFRFNNRFSSLKCSCSSNDLSSRQYTLDWLSSVKSTGTFYYTDPNFDTSITRSASTVPAGWTLEYAG